MLLLPLYANALHSGSLAPLERKAYTDAVLCLQEKTALTPVSLVPGVRTRVRSPARANIVMLTRNSMTTLLQSTKTKHFSSTSVGLSLVGTDIMSGSMNKHFATSVDIKDINLIGIGQNGHRLHKILQSSMVHHIAWEGTGNTSLMLGLCSWHQLDLGTRVSDSRRHASTRVPVNRAIQTSLWNQDLAAVVLKRGRLLTCQ
jgi:hypothetical protein